MNFLRSMTLLMGRSNMASLLSGNGSHGASSLIDANQPLF